MALFTPFTLGPLQLKNRLVVSPMCMYSATDGFFNDFHKVHLGSRAIGGYALIIAEATAVEPEGRISPRCTGLWKDEQIEKLAEIAQFIKEQGCIPGIQLAHAGRKAAAAVPWKGARQLQDHEGGWQTVSSSTLSYGDPLWRVPRELSIRDIEVLQEKWAAAARRAVKAGMQLIEIHAAHGYLIHSFYSPLSNNRVDRYGGSFENRVRFLLEVTQKVKAAIPPSVALIVRITGTDWHPQGWTPDDAVALSKLLKGLGVDLVDVSSGALISNAKDIPVGPGYQVPFAAKVKAEAQVKVGAVGLIDEVTQAEELVRSGKADLVFQARESLRDPYFPYHAAQVLGVKEPQMEPVQYRRRNKSNL